MFKNPKNTFITFLTVSLGILFFGDIMVISASQVTGLTSGGSSFSISWKQLLISLLSLPFAWTIAQIPLLSLKRMARICLGFAIVVMILLIPFGESINGNRNWISFGPIEFQPSEISKLLLIIWSALVIENNIKNPKKIFTYLFVGFSAILVIVLAGGDLGSAVVMGLILGTLVFLSGADMKRISFLGGLGLIGIVGLIAVQPYRIERLTAFIHPFADGIYKNAGWQPAHSLMAMASGGFFGSGLGASKQKWGNLAEGHTDFIFAVIGEELGLLGTLITIAALSLLVFTIIKIALFSKDTFSKYLGLGIACWIGIQSIINLASTTSIIPVVGVTLPFISYGGTSLLALIGALGFVAGIALRNPELSKEINVRWPKGAK